MQITIDLPQSKISAFQSILDGFKEAKIITEATVISVIGYDDVKSFVKEKYKLINERKPAS